MTGKNRLTRDMTLNVNSDVCLTFFSFKLELKRIKTKAVINSP